MKTPTTPVPTDPSNAPRHDVPNSLHIIRTVDDIPWYLQPKKPHNTGGDPNCEQCQALTLKNHAHSCTVFKVISGTYRNHYHTVTLDGDTGPATCSCDGGKARAAYGKQPNCYHIGIARRLLEERRAAHALLHRQLNAMLRSSSYDLFEGDEYEGEDEVEETHTREAA